jgi:hypothetical protein
MALMTFRVRRRLVLAATISTACAGDPTTPSTALLPIIRASSSATNSTNVLSATVIVDVRDADSVAVRFHLTDEISLSDSVTPDVRSSADAATIPVLGLLPSRRYSLRAVAYSDGGKTIGDEMLITTDTLPSDLPKYKASGEDPSAGYIVFAAGLYGIVIDNTGRVVWYHRFPYGAGLSFMAEPNGRYVAKPTNAVSAPNDPWVEIDILGNVTRSLGCAQNLASRPHDLIGQTDGSYWLMCDEMRTMDLASVGGVAAARVTGTMVQHLSSGGAVIFQWSAFDHFDITDGEPNDRKGATVNWTHGNAIDLDTDGNLLVSFRNLNEITKIDAVSGAVIWRMGGRRNQFSFFDSPSAPFAGQHSVRVSGIGEIAILDNVGMAGESRAKRFIINVPAHTAQLAGLYTASPGAVTLIGGSVQPTERRRTLVSFGTAGRVEEYDANGKVVWRIDGNAGYVFRAERILSLYAPGVGTSR